MAMAGAMDMGRRTTSMSPLSRLLPRLFSSPSSPPTSPAVASHAAAAPLPSLLPFKRRLGGGCSVARARHPAAAYFSSTFSYSTCTSSPLCLINDSNNGDLRLHDANTLYQAMAEKLDTRHKLEEILGQVGIVLTTEVVVEVLQKLRYEEKLALQFFTWIGHHEGYNHEAKTYSLMIDILSCTRYKAKQFSIVCDILDYMKRKEKNAVPADVLLTILRNYNI